MVDQHNETEEPKLGSVKSQWLWLIGLWSGGVIALYIVVKILKVFMSAAGLH